MKKVNATRMELLKLKRQISFSKRGHKLLKDKLDGLIQKFMQVVRGLTETYTELEKEVSEAFTQMALASTEIPSEFLEGALMFPMAEAIVTEQIQNLMGVKVPKFKLEIRGETIPYGETFTTESLDKAIETLAKLLPDLLRLAEIIKTVELLASEIVEVRRRVNALEYILIPEQEEARRYIMMKLNEMERSNIISLLKIKEMVGA